MSDNKVLFFEFGDSLDLFFQDGTYISIREIEDRENTFEVLEPLQKIDKPFVLYEDMEKYLFQDPDRIECDEFSTMSSYREIARQQIIGTINSNEYHVFKIPSSFIDIMFHVNEFIFYDRITSECILVDNISKDKNSRIFKINEFLSVRLEWDLIHIYVKERPISQCKYLLLNLPKTDKHIEKIDSIDEAEEHFSHEHEAHKTRLEIPIETEFWGHCSNLQAWAEHDYDTRILHRNLAFPLLKALTEAGDPKAKQVFKQEILKRLLSNHPSVITYLMDEGYLSVFTPDELDMITEDTILFRCKACNQIKIRDENATERTTMICNACNEAFLEKQLEKIEDQIERECNTPMSVFEIIKYLKTHDPALLEEYNLIMDELHEHDKKLIR